MSRSVPEWVGKTDDTPVPRRVRIRIFEQKKSRCHRCTRKIMPCERWTCEHLVALVNGGENRERNLDLTCEFCLPEKNAADVAEKSKVYEKKVKHRLPREQLRRSRPFPNRRDPWGKNRRGNVRDIRDDL